MQWSDTMTLAPGISETFGSRLQGGCQFEHNSFSEILLTASQMLRTLKPQWGRDSIQWPSLFVLLKGTWGSWKPRHWGRTNLHKICKRQRIKQSSRVYGWQDLTVQSVAFNAFSSRMMKKEVQILTWEEFPGAVYEQPIRQCQMSMSMSKSFFSKEEML